MGRLAVWTLVGLCASACSTSGPTAVSGQGGSGGGSPNGSGGTPPLPADATAAGGSGPDATPPVPETDAADSGPTSPTDAVDQGGVGTGCPGGALLCEDFEKYTTPADLAAAWKATASGATMTVDDTRTWKGTKALHIKAAAGTPSAVIVKEGAPLFPIPGNLMYGRVMLWLTGTPGGNYHWNSIQSAGVIPTSMQWGKYGWGGQAGKVLAGYTVRRDAAGSAIIDCSKPSAMAFPAQKWVCVEWAFDGNKNQMHLWFDGQLLTDVDIVGMGNRCVASGDLGKPWAGPVFSNLTIGWQQYQPSSGPLELWLDDLVVDKGRIGCPAP